MNSVRKIFHLNSNQTIQLRLLPVTKPLAERFGPEFFRSVPKQPGVYLMRDADERLLYVGKSVNLRQRLSSYRYLRPEKHSRKLIRLIHAVRKISWEICKSGQDAELRENLLLRTHRPKFNRMNTFPTAYFFIALREHDDGFSLSLTREPKSAGKVYGAFKVSVMYSFAALLRLLWIRCHRPQTIEQFPTGIFGNKLRAFFFQNISMLNDLTQFLEGNSDALLSGSLDSLFAQSAFGKTLIESDLENLTGFFQHGSKRNLDLRKRFMISAPMIAPCELDDLLVLNR